MSLLMKAEAQMKHAHEPMHISVVGIRIEIAWYSKMEVAGVGGSLVYHSHTTVLERSPCSC